MNNKWLSIFIAKVQILVPSMEEINQLRRQGAMVYRVKRHPEGYLVTVRKEVAKQVQGIYPTVRVDSIYPTLVKIIVPIVGIVLLVAMLMQSVPIGYRIEGNLNTEQEQQLESVLMPHFTRLGPFEFLRSDLEAIKSDIKAHYNEYVWVGIERKGSDVVIEVYYTPENATEDEIVYGHTLYARRSGVIQSYDVKTCRVLVELNQFVKQGEPLLTCSVLDPAQYEGQTIPMDEVAQGEIYAQTWYVATLEVKRQYFEEMFTSNSQTHWVLHLGSAQFQFPREELKFEEYEVRSRNVFNPFFFMKESPFFIEKRQSYEKRDIMKENTEEDIKNNAYILLRNAFDQETDEAFAIENLEFIDMSEHEGILTLKYHVTILENIAY